MTCASDPLCHFCNLTYDRCECRLAALKSPPIGGEGELSREQKAALAEQAFALVMKYQEPPFRSKEWLGDNLAALVASIAQPAEECVGGVIGALQVTEHHLNELRIQGNSSETAALVTTSGDVGKLCERLLSEVRFLKTLTDADIERSGTMESTMVRAGLLSEILTAFEAQAARIAALEKALEPSLETKVEYIGEVRETLTMRDEDGEEYSYQHTISWDAIKDIMNMIRTYADECTARALLNPTPTEEGDHERASR